MQFGGSEKAQGFKTSVPNWFPVWGPRKQSGKEMAWREQKRGLEDSDKGRVQLPGKVGQVHQAGAYEILRFCPIKRIAEAEGRTNNNG